MPTLAATVDREDQRRFVGRTRELEVVERSWQPDSTVRIVLLHGPGGIGKSTLVREVRRRAASAGWEVRFLDGRDGVPTSDEARERLTADLPEDSGCLIILDTYERLEPLGPFLRRELIPELPDCCRVLIAQRGAPDPEWLRGGWDRVTTAVELEPISGDEAVELLHRSGVPEGPASEALLSWAAGSPLALAVGADALRDGGTWSAQRLEDRPELADLLVRRLTESELEPSHLDAAAVAAIAWRTDAAMLADVLPGVDGVDSERWLRSRTFAEPLGEWVTLHELVSTALRAWLRRQQPERERELRRRIGEHLYARACAGHAALMPDLAELIENETIRWGLGGLGDGSLRVDSVRADDKEGLAESAAERDAEEWWAATETLLRGAPECVIVARDRADTLVGLCTFTTPDRAPRACDDDPIFSGWLAHAREQRPGEPVIVWRDSLDFTAGHGKESSRVLSVLNITAILRSGVANPRWSYLPIDPENEQAMRFAQIMGAQKVEGLDVRLDARTLECHVLDHGEGGLLAAHRAAIYAETGVRPPKLGDEEPLESPGVPVTSETVKEALRSLDRPLELARSPLATGRSPGERAESVRQVLVAATADAFGEGPQEAILRELVTKAYFSGPATHEMVADELHVSRSTYFRYLRTATDRLATYVLQLRGGTILGD
jgi:hypothetical protein